MSIDLWACCVIWEGIGSFFFVWPSLFIALENSERGRWEGESQSFLAQMSCLSGDCVLAAGFLTYLGFFNITFRQLLAHRWQDKLDALQVVFKPEVGGLSV